MAYSNVRYTLTSGNMGTNSFSYSAFQTLGAGADPENTQFNVYWGDTELVLDTDYTVNTTTNTVTVLSTITGDWAEGDILTIKRDTKKDDRYVDWTNNAGIDEADLDLDSDQLLFIAQEAWDESQNALRKNAAGTNWAGEGLPSNNCAPATTGSGWTTLDQVNNLINGGDTATLGDVNDWCFTGDGTTTDFVMNGAAANTTEENLIVAIDGVLLCPCGDGTAYSPDIERAILDLGSITDYNQIGTTRSAWDGDLDTCYAAVSAVLADYPDIVAHYKITVDTHVTGTAPIPTVPSTFIGTYAECVAYIATWTNDTDTYSGTVRWHRLVGTRYPYTWTQATRTISFTDPPYDGADICIRQITGTVAVDLADVSLDGSEIQDDAITIDHLDFASGTAYRVLKVDSAGDPSVGTITSAYISDFAAATHSLKWSDMAIPTAAVDMNTQRITGLQAGNSSSHAVNYGQLTTTNNRITAIETMIEGGYSGDNSDVANAVTLGVQPDLYYNNASNSRGNLFPSTGATACAMEASAGDSNLLMSGFIPRYLKIFVYGDFTTPGNVVKASNVDHIWEFYNWDSENTFNPVASTEGDNNVYLLNKPTKRKDSNLESTYDWPSTSVDDKTSFYLVIEQVSPWRVWFRAIEDGTTTQLKVTQYGGNTALPGSIQVIAYKAL
jgi:hypothetical protein